MIIITDTREQNPYLFLTCDPKPQVIIKGLPTGDYSLSNFETKVCIERKSKSDLFSSFGKGRDRLQREFERMAQFNYAAMVIECTLEQIFISPPERSYMNPKSVFRSLLSWSIRYRVAFWPCPGRAFAEKTTFHLLRFFWEQNK